jgi:gliding motility-associated-like protein
MKKSVYIKTVSFHFLLFTFCHCLSQQAKPFVSSDIFQTSYFIENHGQFDKYACSDYPVNFAIDNKGDHIYFNANGFVYYLCKVEAPKEKEEAKNEAEKEGRKSKTIEAKVAMQWLNANPHCVIQMETKSKHYFSYGDAQYISYGYKKITYKELYPNIDAEYTIPERGGVKYSLILKPGADLENVKFAYSGDSVELKLEKENLIIKNKVQDIIVSNLNAYYQDKKPLKIKFYIENRIVSFKIKEPIDKNKTLVIDPWLATIATLTATGNGNNKGYDVDYDNLGNLFVYGGGYYTLVGAPENQKVAKYNNIGTLLWTFNGSIPSIPWQSAGTIGSIGNFAVDKSNGKIYIGEGLNEILGTRIVRLDPAGIYDFFASTLNSNFKEIWEMNFDCKKGSVFGMGGSTSSNLNFGQISSTGSFSAINVTGLGGVSQDILNSTLNKKSELYMIFASVSNYAIDNHILKLNNTYTDALWDIASGYNTFSETMNKPYVGKNVSNGFNALAANNDYLFYYDGFNIKAFNVTDGSLAGTPYSINGHSPKYQGGIYADECNNIYIGGNNGNVKVFNFNGSSFITKPDIILNGMTGKHIYDIKFNSIDNLLCLSGESMVGTVPPSQNCTDTINLNITLSADCFKIIVSMNNPDSTSNYSYIWYDITLDTVVRTLANVSKTKDTLIHLMPFHKYSIRVTKDPLCGLGSVIKTFIFDTLRINNHKYYNAGVYVDTLKNNSGCDSIITTNIKIILPSSSTQSLSLCQGDTFRFNKHGYYATGVYMDTLFNSVHCDSVVTTHLEFRPSPFIDFKADTQLCELDHDTIVLDAGIHQDYAWQPNGEITQTIKVTKAGIYTVKVSNEVNCSFTASKEVFNICKPSIFIPNAFTPNGDGVNDFFKPVAVSIIEFNMIIYNRWGELVYETDNLEPGWDGEINYQCAPQDVYIYVISGRGINSKAFSKKGTFTLLR